MNLNMLRNVVLTMGVLALVAGVAIMRNRNTLPASVPPQASQSVVVAEVTTAPQLVPRMVDLGAHKCIPCKRMAPILAELKTEYAGRAEIEFIDIWKNPDAGHVYGVRVIPTQVFYDRTGKEVWRHEGFLDKPEIVAKLKELGAV